jgi:hypothetical protein
LSRRGPTEAGVFDLTGKSRLTDAGTLTVGCLTTAPLAKGEARTFCEVATSREMFVRCPL